MDTMTKALLGLIALVLVLWGGYTLLDERVEEDDDHEETEEVVVEAPPTGPIKIGFVGPLTGDAAAYGVPGQKIFDLAAEEINAAGGINGRMIEMVYEDGKCTGKDAANAMQKLVNVDGVRYFVSGFCSGESLAMVPIATQNKVVMLSPASSSPELTGISPYFFRNYPSDADQSRVLAELSAKNEWTNVAVISEKTDYAQALGDAYATAMEKQGATVTADSFTTDSRDLRTPLTKLKVAEPQAIFVSTQTDASAETILTQIKDMAWDVQLILAETTMGSTLPSEKPELVEGAVGAQFHVDEDSEALQAFVTSYKEKYEEDVPFLAYGQTEYDAVYILAQAIREAGDDTDAVAQYLRDLENYDGVSGPTAFAETGDRSVGGFTPQMITNGVIENIEL